DLVVHFLGLVRRPVHGRAGHLGVAATAAMADLRDQERAVLVGGLGELRVPGDDRVVPVVDAAPVGGERGGVDAGGAEGLDHPHAARGLVGVVVQVALGGLAVAPVAGGVRGGDDAVLGRLVADLDRAEEQVQVCHGGQILSG